MFSNPRTNSIPAPFSQCPVTYTTMEWPVSGSVLRRSDSMALFPLDFVVYAHELAEYNSDKILLSAKRSAISCVFSHNNNAKQSNK